MNGPKGLGRFVRGRQVLLASPAMLLSVGSATAQTLDQSAVGGVDLHVLIPGAFLAQTYTAGLTGTLASVNLKIDGIGLTVQIRDVVLGVPGSSILGSATVPGALCCGLTAVPFSSTIAQVAGTQYAIVVTSTSGSATEEWIASQVSYAGGVPLKSLDGVNWFSQIGGSYDLDFQTFVNTVPTYSCTGFQDPFDNALLLKAKANRSIPLKAQLFDGNNVLVDAAALGTAAVPVVNVSFSSVAGPAIDDTASLDAAGLASSGNNFSFDPATGNWQFNLGSKAFTAPGTYTVTMISGEVSQYTISPTCSGQFVRQ